MPPASPLAAHAGSSDSLFKPLNAGQETVPTWTVANLEACVIGNPCEYAAPLPTLRIASPSFRCLYFIPNRKVRHGKQKDYRKQSRHLGIEDSQKQGNWLRFQDGLRQRPVPDGSTEETNLFRGGNRGIKGTSRRSHQRAIEVSSGECSDSGQG